VEPEDLVAIVRDRAAVELEDLVAIVQDRAAVELEDLVAIMLKSLVAIKQKNHTITNENQMLKLGGIRINYI
jgi:hypothetical protein